MVPTERVSVLWSTVLMHRVLILREEGNIAQMESLIESDENRG